MGNDKTRVVIVIHRTTHAELIQKRKGAESFDGTIRRLLKLTPIVRRPTGPKPTARPVPERKVNSRKGHKKGR
jgi:hypothetical protein